METQKPKVTPKDFFFWVAAIAALYVSAVSFLALLFSYIDFIFADPLSYTDPYSGGMRFATASLFIIFPLFLYLFRKLQADIRKNPEKEDLWIRRWLIFLSLFVGGITIVVDLIVLVNSFLGGEELTAAFLLKVLAVLIVIGGAFLYFVKDIQGYWQGRAKLSRGVGIFVALVVLASVISGFFIIGSPQTQRELRLDQERVQDLQSIQWNVTDYYQRTGELPEELSVLEDPLTGFSLPADPQTGEPYEYRRVEGEALTFELCATFAEASRGFSDGAPSPRPIERPVRFADGNEFWEHDSGRTCFQRTIDPEKFPKNPR